MTAGFRAGPLRGLVAAVLFCWAAGTGAVGAWSPAELFTPCEGDCAVSLFGGNYVENSMGQVLVTSPELPFTWDYQDDHFIGTTVARDVGKLWRFRLEPEVGIGQRFGEQSATEVWGALFFRYRGFPWDRYLVTTVAFSTGLNWASEVTEIEQERAKDGEGSQVMHYFAPEITLALPQAPDIELMFRFHHRSGVFGLVSDAFGGAQYGTVGLRVRF